MSYYITIFNNNKKNENEKINNIFNIKYKQ